MAGNYGIDEYGTSPYGGEFPPYGLEAITPLTPTLIRVRYTALFDSAFSPLLSIDNYSIFPALTIHAVVIESAQTVLLITDPQVDTVYTLTIGAARGYFGQPLDADLDSRTFNGLPSTPTFFAVATRSTRVRAVFTEPMLQNAALTDPGQYVLTDLSGNVVPILTVVQEQASNVRSVVLTLGAQLVDERHYRLTTLGGIVTADSQPLTPDTSIFQWVANASRTQIPLDRFSGEVQNGLYGIHGGLVFFSPALEAPAANSVIQVEQVDVCTRAYDVYTPPQPIDPPVFFTHGAGIAPTPVTTLNSTAVLWAKFPHVVDARFDLSNLLADSFPAPVDGPCTATLTERWDLDFISLLNNTTWKLFDNAGEPPRYFKTADNLAPIPPGSTVIIPLQP